MQNKITATTLVLFNITSFLLNLVKNQARFVVNFIIIY